MLGWVGRGMGHRGLAVVSVLALSGLAFCPVDAQAATSSTTTTPPPTSISVPATSPPLTAPLGADENLRGRTLAEVSVAKKALAAAQRTEAQMRVRAATLARSLAGLASQRAALDDEERAAANNLEATRVRVRSAAVSGYVSGGRTTIANQLLQSANIETFTRNRVYGSTVLEFQERLLVNFSDALSKVSETTSNLGRQSEKVTTEQNLVTQELQILTSERVLREEELAQKQTLNQLVTAAAPVLPSDIPALVLDAYVRGAAAANRRTPSCRIHWSALAAIGRTESGHARSGGASLTLAGDVAPRILGPRLDGNGFALITDTDAGTFDGDLEFDRAVGPMQFIPTTWRSSGEDGNGDGRRDPNNVYDGVTAAGMYLCRSRLPLDIEGNLFTAALNYNHSSAYATQIVNLARGYILLRLDGLPLGPTPPTTPFVPVPTK